VYTSQQEAGYRLAAAQGATQIGIHVLAYDALAREISAAGRAASSSTIDKRCLHTNRALMLIGHLESWSGYLEDPKLSASLSAFYAVLRETLMSLQQSRSLTGFLDLAQHVVETRAVWQQKEHQLLTAKKPKDLGHDRSSPAPTETRLSFSCSA
jgi:flagellin-specific chaperone FliS